MVQGLFKKKKAVQVEYCELPSSMVVSEVDSLEKLKELGQQDHFLIETDNEIYQLSVEDDLAFRYNKPSSMPRIIKVEKLELNPDSFSIKAQLSQHDLFDFARRQGLFLFETPDSFYIPSGEVVLYAQKDSAKK